MDDDQSAAADVTAKVRDYYGEVLKSTADLQTSACCTAEAMPRHLSRLLADIHDEVKDRFYGCGSPIPPALAGATVLDLGCGSGRDAYLMSRLVGAEGRVIGVDMTEAQLAVARRHLGWHADKFGYANVDFRHGFIEDLAGAGIADNSVDVVVSNCVLNLSPDKPQVFREIFRVLKPGGELYFSDVFSDRRVPVPLTRDPVLLGECLGGAMYVEDFRRLMAQVGCLDVRTCGSAPIAVLNPQIAEKLGNIQFRSLTVRAFKLALEDRCEDYGQVARYLGTIPDHPHVFELDDHHRLETGRPMLVCGNTADMLTATRYGAHFQIDGNQATHFGLFDCAPPALDRGDKPAGACC
ncbi:methyltransferase domain-containing protein [Sinimarinibacterium sp. CAU 1509]|uniref:methyltransferase domain-containing protein n=1 Tax=Sinimarinibacterium sp. CAU 1509 TaxID=2562283 RepID=UPI0010ACD22B|nr:methyltransferase domain-containing protein [Sinimarinibacterium sp. CAU 1509]TJY55934.1 methyltransferase domain-containing protein [Sinimarinibacterium sp. CAU 1509]